MSRRRLILLIAVLLIDAIAMMLLSTLSYCVVTDPADGWGEWFGWITEPSRWRDDPEAWILVVLPGLFIAATQAAFIIPIYRNRLTLEKNGRPLVVALVGAAFIAALLSAALLLAATDLVSLLARGRGIELDMPLLVLVPLVPLVGSWLLWTPLLVIFARKRPHRARPGRLVGLLLGGTIAELLIVIPIDILVRQRTGCHCSTPAFHATWFSTLALLWLTGPGVLIAVWSRRRAPWLEKHCANCGYPKGQSPGTACPECGYSWL